MDDKELEQQLQESANAVKIRGFSSRWKEIKKQMPPRKKNYKRTLKYLIAVATGSCAIALAVILPLVLRPNKEFLYYLPIDVPFDSTTEEKFYQDLASADFETVDFSSVPIEEYFIGRTEDQVVRGGALVYNNEDGLSEYVFVVTFYSPEITFTEADFSGLTDTVTVEGTEVAYKTTVGDLYESRAFFVYKDVSYIVNYTSLNDDLEEFLSMLIS